MDSPTLMRLVARMKQLRTQLGLTQEEFASKFGLSYKYYQAIEEGK
jgi:transcriptional regulator with XRE-family HTH domain